ncbi:hypothetical protein DFH27DRAFT_561862 [Peziza echinospora]|nr:hypothetical protein DFH27DRAFT_561862 [Peziza echinospora]
MQLHYLPTAIAILTSLLATTATASVSQVIPRTSLGLIASLHGRGLLVVRDDIDHSNETAHEEYCQNTAECKESDKVFMECGGLEVDDNGALNGTAEEDTRLHTCECKVGKSYFDASMTCLDCYYGKGVTNITLARQEFSEVCSELGIDVKLESKSGAMARSGSLQGRGFWYGTVGTIGFVVLSGFFM